MSLNNIMFLSPGKCQAKNLNLEESTFKICILDIKLK